MSDALAAAVLDALAGRGERLATAESLTGGGLGARLTAVPRASKAYAGGLVAYATEVKIDLLGVPLDVVEREGVVSAACALRMAVGVRALLGVDVGVATTGVAGPDTQEGKPVGQVFVAVSDSGGDEVVELHATGDREEIRTAAAAAALELVARRITANHRPDLGGAG